jgi:geranylgeranyl pyrophosphate synthase
MQESFVLQGHSSSQRTEDVVALAEAFAVGHARTPQQRRLLEQALEGLRVQARHEQAIPFPCAHLPLLVYAALRGDDAPALPLAVATSLLYLGLDIFDDLADGDLPPHWDGYRPSDINLAAATLLCALPQLAIAELDAPPASLAAMQHTLAAGLLAMGAGQQQDIAMAGTSNVTAADVEASVAAKSGEEIGLFTRLAAQFAGAPSAVVDPYTRMGRALGTAMQLASDCYDLFQDPHGSDLANGTRTLPIALHLDRQTGAARAAFLNLLEQARQDEAAQEAVRKHLREAGDLRRCAVIIEVYCQRALRALEQAAPQEPAAGGLRAMIGGVSFFPKGDKSQ